MLFWLDVESYRHISWKPKFVLGIGSEDFDKAKKILGEFFLNLEKLLFLTP